MWGLDTERMSTMFANSVEQIVAYLPTVLAAIAVLVLGWVLAAILGAIARGIARRTGLSRQLRSWFDSEQPAVQERSPDVDRAIGKGVFYLAMVFVLVAFFQVLGLTLVTTPLNEFLGQLFAYLPQLVGAMILLAVAWGVAVAVRFLVRRGIQYSRIDRRLERHADVDTEAGIPLSKTLSEAAYWLTFLLFLPAVLDALALSGLLGPVQSMVGEVLSFLPNLLAAGLILTVGWFVARILERIVSNLLASVGFDRLGDRVGITRVLGRSTPSKAAGLVVYVLVFLPVLVAALNALELAAVTAPASLMLTQVLAALPQIFAACLVIAVAYVVGRILAELTTRLLSSIGFNRLPAQLGLAGPASEMRRTPAEIAGNLVLVGVILAGIMWAMPFLGFQTLSVLMAEFLVFAGQVIVGLAIFAFGLYLGRIAANAIRDSNVAQADLLAFLAHAGIVVLAGAMALQEMGVGAGIIMLAFGLFAGAIAVASAVAFGIGGREAAKDAVDRFYYNRLLARHSGNGSPGDGAETQRRERERESQST